MIAKVSGTETFDMDKPPPYEEHQGSINPAYAYPVQDAKWQDGYSNPGYAFDTSYTPTKNAENSQTYNPPIVSNIDYSSEVNPKFYSTQSAKSSSKKVAVGDGAECGMTGFGEQAIRRGFIRKVFLTNMNFNHVPSWHFRCTVFCAANWSLLG